MRCACAVSCTLSISNYIWNPRPHFANSLFNFYEATMMIKGSLIVSVPIIVKLFSALRMRCITWAISMVSGTQYIWNPRHNFAYSLCNFYGATMTSKRSLLVSVPLLSGFRPKIFSPAKIRIQTDGFRENRGLHINFILKTPKKHILARIRVFWRILWEGQFGGLGCALQIIRRRLDVMGTVYRRRFQCRS